MASNEDSFSEDIPRRGFFKFAILALNGLIAAALAVPGLGYLLTPVFRKGSASWVNLGNIGDFSAGIPQKSSFSYVSESGYSQREKTKFVWVVRNTEEPDRVMAFSAECTHTGCNVDWESSEQKFICPCHEGRYDVQGQVLSGPPPKPLTQLPARTDNGDVFVRILT